MSYPVTVGLLLPEPYTPLPTFNQEVARLDDRIDAVSTSQLANAAARLDALEREVATLSMEFAALKGTAAAVTDVQNVEMRVQTMTGRVDDIDTRLGGFSFRYGDVAAYNALGTLAPRQMFLVVDTPDALQIFGESNANTFKHKAFGLVFASN